jgi:hypothetical protein
MSQEPKSNWRKSWKRPRGFLLWLIPFTLVFIVIYAGDSVPFFLKNYLGLPAYALFFSLLVTLILLLAVQLVRWLFCRRNLKKSIFGCACFATLVALFYAEEDWRGKHDWEKYKHEWEARGEKFDFADFVPPPIPDDRNFALTPVVFTSYGQMLMRDGKPIPFDKRDPNFVNRLKMDIAKNYEESPKDGNWQLGRMTDLKAWRDYYRALGATTNEFPVAPQPQLPATDVLLALSKYDPVIEELRQAGQSPDSRFPLNYDIENPGEILLPHLAVLKQCSLALQLRSLAELAAGQNEKAFADVKLALRLVDSIRTEPFIITQLVRMAMLQITLQPVWEGLAEHKWSDVELAELDSELSKLDFPADYEFSVRGERASHGKIIDWIEQKRSRYWILADMINGNQANNTSEIFLESTASYLVPQGWFYQNKISLAQVEQQWNLPMVDATNQIIAPKMVLAGMAGESSLRRTPFNFFALLLAPGFGVFAQRTAYAQNAVNLARVAIALERYRLAQGRFPESLDVLAPQFMEKIPHDIINGQPLHYRRPEDGQFVLYSVGWNETDDGGVVGLTTSGNAVDNRAGDWVWRYPAK